MRGCPGCRGCSWLADYCAESVFIGDVAFIQAWRAGMRETRGMTADPPQANDAPTAAARRVGGTLGDFVTGIVAVHGDLRRARSMLAVPTGATVVHVHFGGSDKHSPDAGTSL